MRHTLPLMAAALCAALAAGSAQAQDAATDLARNQCRSACGSAWLKNQACVFPKNLEKPPSVPQCKRRAQRTYDACLAGCGEVPSAGPNPLLSQRKP